MSEKKNEKKMCVFDYGMECPFRASTQMPSLEEFQVVGMMLEKACPICPIRIKMLPEEMRVS